jgi:Fe-S cluster biogenesis protein NfuA
MTFSDQDLYEAVKYHLPKVEEYIGSHGGTIELLGVKDGKVYIRLAGNCSGCSMSLMTTKMVVQRRLRELIHPELEVVNVDGITETEPEGLYRGEEAEQTVFEGKQNDKSDDAEHHDKKGLLGKIKKAIQG